MRVSVDYEPKLYFLSIRNNRWKKCAGHGISVGDYEFFIAHTNLGLISVGEVQTGMRVLSVSVNDDFYKMTPTKDEVMEFYLVVIGRLLVDLLNAEEEGFKLEIQNLLNKMAMNNVERPPILPFVLEEYKREQQMKTVH